MRFFVVLSHWVVEESKLSKELLAAVGVTWVRWGSPQLVPAMGAERPASVCRAGTRGDSSPGF